MNSFSLSLSLSKIGEQSYFTLPPPLLSPAVQICALLKIHWPESSSSFSFSPRFLACGFMGREGRGEEEDEEAGTPIGAMCVGQEERRAPFHAWMCVCQKAGKSQDSPGLINKRERWRCLARYPFFTFFFSFPFLLSPCPCCPILFSVNKPTEFSPCLAGSLNKQGSFYPRVVSSSFSLSPPLFFGVFPLLQVNENPGKGDSSPFFSSL